MIIPSALFYAIFAWEFKILHAQVTALKRLGIEDVKDKESCLYFRYALYLSTFLEVIPSLIGQLVYHNFSKKWSLIAMISILTSTTNLLIEFVTNLYRLLKGNYDRSNNFQMTFMIALSFPFVLCVVSSDFVLLIMSAVLHFIDDLNQGKISSDLLTSLPPLPPQTRVLVIKNIDKHCEELPDTGITIFAVTFGHLVYKIYFSTKAYRQNGID